MRFKRQIQILEILNKWQRLLPKRLVLGLFVSLVLVGCESTKDLWQELSKVNLPINNSKPPQVAVQSSAIAKMETAIQQEINKIREQNGLKPLRRNEDLAKVARNYSKQMAIKNFFAHVSPEGSTLEQRMNSAGIVYIVVGENLFRSKNIAQPVNVAVKGWMNSPGHRKNILYPTFNETGIGIWKQGNSYYITQLFMRSLSLD